MPRTYDTFKQIKVPLIFYTFKSLDEVLQRTVKIKGFQLYSNGKRKTSIRFDNIGEGLSDFPYMMVVFEQNKNETILHENLLAQGKDVMWNTFFIELTEQADFVEATVETESGTATIRAKHIIGCDGALSPVRHQKDFTFEGGTYENKFYVADVRLGNNFDQNSLMLAPSDETFTAFFRWKGSAIFALSVLCSSNFLIETILVLTTSRQKSVEPVVWS